MKPPRFYFSLRSPYSWLAYQDLMTQYPDVAERLEWRPFWEPDAESLRMLTEAGGSFPYVAMSRAKALYILQDVRREAARRGLAIAWPVDRAPCGEVSHLAYLVARRHGQGPPFIAAAYRARWVQGRDISDPATIGEIAVELGLDPAELSGAVSDPGTRKEGLHALQAVDADGVFGVPYFLYGRDRYWGIDRLPDFVAAVRAGIESIAAPAGENADPTPGGDQGHAGGCG